jgi:hypothetical protein
MPRHQPARDETTADGFTEEPRYERLLQRTDVELAWIYDRHPELKRTISIYQADKAAARKAAAVAARAAHREPSSQPSEQLQRKVG